MKVGIIGAKGFIGQQISDHLNAQEVQDTEYYDVIIDANGSSKKYKAELNPSKDVKASVISVMEHVDKLKYGKYIYLSTIDAEYLGISKYGFNRHMAENYVQTYANNWTIVRLCSVIGPTAVKGIVFDILNDKKLYVTKDSCIQVIPVSVVAKSLEDALDKYDQKILKLYSIGNISVENMCKLFGKDPEVDKSAQVQMYDGISTLEYAYKTAEEYLKETFHERMVKSVESV